MKQLLSIILLLGGGTGVIWGVPSVRGPFANPPKVEGEFSQRLPLDWHSVANRWAYRIRFHYLEHPSGQPISVFLVREGQTMILASVNFRKLQKRDFDLLDAKEKLAVSTTTEIDDDLAQALYGVWIKALFAASPSGGGSTGGSFIYISAYGVDSGYLSAYSEDAEPGTRVGRIVEIGRMLQRYAEMTPGDPQRGKLRERILRICSVR
jgi:hypothetical protein